MAKVEIVQESQLAVIVRESNLEPTKAKFILEKFTDYFEIASEWEKKAKAIVVTKDTQTAEMEMARTGRLFLKEKRVAVEKARKELKEQALREGKAIDGIANVLKALIVPIEEYLEQQERFVEIQKEKKEEAMRLEIQKRIEAEEAAKAKADAEEKERLRIENEKLRQEAEVKEKQRQIEHRKQEEALAKERAKAAAEREKAEAARRAIEEKAQKEREAREKELAKEREKIEIERRKQEEKTRKEKEVAQAKIEAERKEKERLAEMLKNQIECPFCHKKFNIDKSK